MHMRCPQVWARRQSLLLVVSRAQRPGKDSICLDLCLNLNPDRLASPSSPLPPSLPLTHPPFFLVRSAGPLAGLCQCGLSSSWELPARHGSARFAWTFPTGNRERGGEETEDTSLLRDMENRPAETNSEVDKSASPSVAQLAGKFKEQAANIPGKEVPPHKPTRRKPPCSLPLYSHKTETSDNDEQKRSPNACPIPKVKVKSSPMIEKLQANLAFAPAALLPGVSPKSPGMKVLVSPFSTPPSTPTSPGTQSQPSETPVSFDQPPESTQLQFYNKVRTRGSIKRRPPSRRFRRSLSEYGDGEDLGVNLSSPENGAREDEVFGPNGKTEEVETGSKEQKKQAGSDEKPASRTGSSRSEDEEKESKEQKKQAESDEKPLSRRGSSRSEDGEKGKKQAEEITACKNNTGKTKEEEVCRDGPGEENSSQPPSGNNEMCDSPQGEEQQSTACEQGKGDKEKDEAEAETKESSESTDTQRTSDTEETALAPEPLQDAVGLGTASEPSVSVTQDQGTA